MEKVMTIQGSTYQDRIDAFKEALEHLNAVKKIITSHSPSRQDHAELEKYAGAIFEAESDCSSTIIDLSTAISELVKDDTINSYL